jgi:hypothetical protein
MRHLIEFLLAALFGWIGWVLGERIGFMTAYFASGFASLLGYYAGWRISRSLLG